MCTVEQWYSTDRAKSHQMTAPSSNQEGINAQKKMQMISVYRESSIEQSKKSSLFIEKDTIFT
jgi:hypothetical protein